MEPGRNEKNGTPTDFNKAGDTLYSSTTGKRKWNGAIQLFYRHVVIH